MTLFFRSVEKLVCAAVAALLSDPEKATVVGTTTEPAAGVPVEQLETTLYADMMLV